MFDVIPIIQAATGIRIASLALDGVSTKQSGHTQGGRMFASVTTLGATYRLALYSGFPKAVETLVASGEGTIGEYGFIVEENNTGISGRFRLTGSGEPIDNAIVIVSLAVDKDIFKRETAAAGMPGYDADIGLAEFHAAAMRRILLSDLPASLPYLYYGKDIGSFVPESGTEQFPDLRGIQAPDSLRDAQSNLVKALSARESNHLVEFADMEENAIAAYDLAMKSFTAANVPAVDDITASGSTIRVGEFYR